MFRPETFFFASLVPPLLGFWSHLIVFYFTLMGIFEKLLGVSPFECFKAFLVCRHVAFPISNGGIGLISSYVIALATYLRNWALVAHVIASRFLLDSCPFLLGAISASNSGSLPF
jgi:hypothetical protein